MLSTSLLIASGYLWPHIDLLSQLISGKLKSQVQQIIALGCFPDIVVV